MLLISCFIFAFIFASFIEYWIHRLLHIWPWLGKSTSHYNHHYRNKAPGMLRDFKDYSLFVLVMCPAFFISLTVGIGVFLGSLVYTTFAAYAHQLQHENPSRCFWMRSPVHTMHHQRGQWHHNYGLTVDWWDHVFGTYKVVEWQNDSEISQPERGLQVKW